MVKNVGNIDKSIRVIIALVLFSLFFFLEGNLRYLGLLGLIPLITAFASWCPIYRVLGINSCKLK